VYVSHEEEEEIHVSGVSVDRPPHVPFPAGEDWKYVDKIDLTETESEGEREGERQRAREQTSERENSEEPRERYATGTRTSLKIR
jgi:hypothetical protein